MPTYNMKNTKTGEVTEMFLKISERDDFLRENPDFVQELSAPPKGDSVRLGVTRTSDGFKDVLRHIKSHHYKSTIDV